MTFWMEAKRAMDDYLDTGVDITIEDVQEVGNPGADTIQPGEPWQLRVRVRNRGFLDTENVIVKINGRNGAMVAKSADGPWDDRLRTSALDISSGHEKKTELVYFKAAENAGPMELIEANIAQWNAGLSSLLLRYTKGAETPSAVHSDTVILD